MDPRISQSLQATRQRIAMGWGKIGLRPRGSRMSISQPPPPPLLARRDGAMTTGIHSPQSPPYPKRWWYLCPVYSGCIP